jgi:DNA-binding NtrC family response regulator
VLDLEHLGLSVPNETGQAVVPAATYAAMSSNARDRQSGFPTLAEIEKQHILAALHQCNGNRTHAAKLLDVSIRTLRNKLHEYNGSATKFSEPAMSAGV